MSQVVGLPNNSNKSITNTAWVRAWLCNLQKGCTRLADASDKVYLSLAHGRWFSPGTPATSTTKTSRHDIAEILLKVALKHQKLKNQIPLNVFVWFVFTFSCLQEGSCLIYVICVCLVCLYLQLFVGGLMSYLRYMCWTPIYANKHK